jgi:TfoX/Sxy family transcriptional regulator of competence genes
LIKEMYPNYWDKLFPGKILYQSTVRYPTSSKERLSWRKDTQLEINIVLNFKAFNELVRKNKMLTKNILAKNTAEIGKQLTSPSVVKITRFSK